MELPIFNELESVWFRTRRRAPEPAVEPTDTTPDSGPAGDGGDKTEYATVNAASTTTGNAAMGDNAPVTASDAAAPVSAGRVDGGAPDTGWRTAADEGWRAASQVAEVKVTEVTAAGLPKRRPMAQLVPGGVADKGASSAGAQRRTPEAVRGLLSAYHRGVQRGRKQHTEGGGGNPPSSTQAGKEHEA